MDGRPERGNRLFLDAGLGITTDMVEESDDSNMSSGGSSNSVEPGSKNSHISLPAESEEEGNSVGDEYHGSDVEPIVFNDMTDIMKVDMENFSMDDVGRYDFASLDVAYLFYCWFARMSGFSVRKGQMIRDREGVVLQQTFVCSCQGFREARGLTCENRKREPRNETRCGCKAKFRVHVDIVSKRWYVTVFEIDHNHELLGGTLCGLLPAYRKMSEGDIDEIERNRKAGIRPYQLYGTMANACGGFHKVGFVKKDLYNQVGKQRKKLFSDASGAVKYLRDLNLKDPLMFVTHTLDKEKRLERLFWSDGESRMNYEIFGDVLAFDATYRKNKYNCPFVIFSGVNHHNQTIVFGTGIVTRETEETYVWLLEQFLSAMKGKHPLSVITDGDLAMRNAIKRILPKAHHRLCAWHLLRNASSNIGIPEVMAYLKKCMLGDLEVSAFEKLWAEMVQKFGLQNNNWINEMYDKKKMWATAHIRGCFFAGIRTTSRCEALHSHMGHYVHSRISMTDFVQQFHRCLTYFRFREIESDFQSNYGQPVLQTSLRSIERSAAKLFTKEIFFLFRSVLKKALLLRITECQEMSTGCIFRVSKYCGDGSEWHVTFCEEPVDLKCSCLRMESLGLPCDHIIVVLLYLDFEELPNCLVLPRWSKFAKDLIREKYSSGSLYWDSQSAARYSGIVEMCKVVAGLVYEDIDEYHNFVESLGGEIRRLKIKNNVGCSELSPVLQMVNEDDELLDPDIVRTKGCGSIAIDTPGRRKRTQTCSICGVIGHNKRCCPQLNLNLGGHNTSPLNGEEEIEDHDVNYNYHSQTGIGMQD